MPETRPRPPAPPTPLPALLLLLFTAFLFACPIGRSDRPVGRQPQSDAMGALQFLAAQRAYPAADIPPRGYDDAWQDVAARVQLARLQGARVPGYTEPDAWQPIGPDNVGGRTIALAVDPRDPDTWYAGAASGGLWRTRTAGDGVDAWSYIDTGFPVLGVNAIAIDTSGTGALYIGTGEVYGKETSIGGLYIRLTRGSYGIGILKSTDEGATWSKSLDWSYDQRRGVLDLVVDAGRPGTLFAGTSEGVYRTTDAGATWTLVLDVPMAVDLAINPVDGDTVFASCGNLGVPADAGIWRTTDGGDTWSELGGGLPATWTGKTLLDIYAAASNVIYADVAEAEDGYGLFRSVDSGLTWEHLSSIWGPYHNIATYQGFFAHFVAVHPADSSRVVVAGVDVFKSVDGGRTFSRKSAWNHWYGGVIPPDGPEGPPDYSHADHHTFARYPGRPSTLILGNDGGVFFTQDFAETFEGRNGGYQTTQFYNGFTSAHFDGDFALGGLQDNSTVVYHGTDSWERTLGGDGGMTGVNPYDTDQIVASTQYGRLYRRFHDQSGSYWRFMNGEMQDGGDVAFVAPFAQSPLNHSIAYAGRTRVYRTDDFIDTWRLPGGAGPLDGNPVLSIALYAQDPDVVWAATAPAGTRAGVFRSTNGGNSWQNVTHGLPDRYPVDFVASRGDPLTAWIVFSGFGTGHLYRTTDGGASWTDLSAGLPDIPSSAFAVDPNEPDYLYFGNDFGVWFSPDGGTTWDPFNMGMPTAALVMDLSISPASQTIRAVTHGNGVWERTLVSAADGGTGPGGGYGLTEPQLQQNWPNPFNGQTRIVYYLAEAGHARIVLRNVRGQQVRVLLDEDVSAGYHNLALDSGGLASGVYLYTLEAAGFVRTRRLLIVR